MDRNNFIYLYPNLGNKDDYLVVISKEAFEKYVKSGATRVLIAFKFRLRDVKDVETAWAQMHISRRVYTPPFRQSYLQIPPRGRQQETDKENQQLASLREKEEATKKVGGWSS